jgi:hypothetical protein
MFGTASGLLAVLAVSASVVQGQAVWASNQVNTTICQWEQFRGKTHRFRLHRRADIVPAHVVRDTVYMDGGGLWWLPGLSDGSYATPESDRKWIVVGLCPPMVLMFRRKPPWHSIHT